MRHRRTLAALLIVVVTAGCTGAVPGLGGAGPIDQTPDSAEAVFHVDADGLEGDPATTTIIESLSEENPSMEGPEELGSDFEEEFNVAPGDVSEVVVFTEDVETAGGYGEQSVGLVVHGEFDSDEVVDGIRNQSTDLEEVEYNDHTLYTGPDQSLAGDTAAVAVLDDGQIVIGDRASVESVVDTTAGDADALSGDLRDEYDTATDGALVAGATEFPGEELAGQSVGAGIDTSVLESVTLASYGYRTDDQTVSTELRLHTESASDAQDLRDVIAGALVAAGDTGYEDLDAELDEIEAEQDSDDESIVVVGYEGDAEDVAGAMETLLY
ncbi:hypothetical protein SAMN04488066_11736 [Halorubrum aquaticum]|uniref:Uncharacterized protein n=1 Tax=Halorubrum aquaticum TaxID=387340 RepID=A0A1I3C077_9EURY|nr:hypothetical protein [Halorubrum aquaticum]SFH68018.1 hypothetical protein SAMN04488066_11736 [Halorubrum aquaticum]